MTRIEKIVFVSYRRTDVPWALTIFQSLTSRGYDVFFDFTSIASGNFEQVIIGNIKARAHFLVLLTPTALERCDEPGDWLRREIEMALDTKRNIVLLLLDGFDFSAPSVDKQLSGKLATLKGYNALRVPVNYFEAAMDRLCGQFLNVPLEAVLHSVPHAVERAVKQEQMAARTAVTARDTNVERWTDAQPITHVAGEPVGPASGERLSGARLRELLGAMLDAYTSESSLRQMVRFELDENLDIVAGGGDLSEKMFNLIDWAERTGHLSQLVEKAHGYNPGNARLRAFAESMPGVTVVAEARKTPAQPRTAKREEKRPAPASPIAFDWVTIPAGEFLMGSDKSKDSMAYDDETPQHTVDLPEYHIARVPVTNVQYQRFVADTSRGAPPHWKNGEIPEGKEDHPVVNVSWHDVQAFCAWAKVRLPSEAEWEKAARSTDGRIYPWGNQKPTDRLCNFDGNVGDTTPVGNYPDGASPYGLLDVAGNEWEWTSSLFQSYPYDANDGREDSQAGGSRTLRGGSWLNYVRYVRCAFGNYYGPDYRYDYFGFRVMSPSVSVVADASSFHQGEVFAKGTTSSCAKPSSAITSSRTAC